MYDTVMIADHGMSGIQVKRDTETPRPLGTGQHAGPCGGNKNPARSWVGMRVRARAHSPPHPLIHPHIQVFVFDMGLLKVVACLAVLLLGCQVRSNLVYD